MFVSLLWVKHFALQSVTGDKKTETSRSAGLIWSAGHHLRTTDVPDTPAPTISLLHLWSATPGVFWLNFCHLSNWESWVKSVWSVSFLQCVVPSSWCFKKNVSERLIKDVWTYFLILQTNTTLYTVVLLAQSCVFVLVDTVYLMSIKMSSLLTKWTWSK